MTKSAKCLEASKQPGKKELVINMEFGNFDSKDLLVLPRTPFDEEIDIWVTETLLASKKHAGNTVRAAMGWLRLQRTGLCEFLQQQRYLPQWHLRLSRGLHRRGL